MTFRNATRTLLPAGLLAPLLLLGSPAGKLTPAPAAATPGTARLGIPLTFVPNRGQLPAGTAFTTLGTKAATAFRSSAVSFALGGHTVHLRFLGARKVAPTGLRRAHGVISDFRGRRAKWRTGIPTYSSIVYRGLWPGIDTVFAGPGRLESTYVVAPGADPGRIAVHFDGAGRPSIGTGGTLVLRVGGTALREGAPRAFQLDGGRRVPVAVRYRLDGRVARLDVGRYDRHRPLLIDPPSFVYAGYLGTTDWSAARSVRVRDGYAYVAGFTSGDNEDAYVAKIKADGTGLVYFAKIGGSGLDDANAVDIDADGNAYVTGWTSWTPQADFPVTVGPDLVFNGFINDYDAWVAKLDPSGTNLDYAGFIGGLQVDAGLAIAVGADDAAYVAGYTGSTQNQLFPLEVGPDLTFNGYPGQDVDAFVARVKPDGTELDYAGYLGGNAQDVGRAIAVDSTGAAYVGGSTASQTFPSVGGLPGTQSGWTDGFISKVEADGSALAYSGLIGGAGPDEVDGVAVDPSGAAYIAGGATSSPALGFPVSVGPELTFGGDADAFLAKVAPDGNSFLSSGYIGGSKWDWGSSVALDDAGNAYVAGYTESPETDFPSLDGPDLTANGNGDAYVAKVKADRTGLVYATFLGGAKTDGATSVAVDQARNAYVVGTTASSPEFGFPVTVGPSLSFNGHDEDAFAAKISASDGDTTPPVSGIDGSGVSNPSTSASATFRLLSSEPRSQFGCSLDGAPFGPCSSPVSFTKLPRRSHSFRVQATDPAGNVDPTPAEFRWTTGGVPSARLLSKPGNPSGADVSFSFESQDPGASFQCRLGTGTFSPCSSPATYSGLADGSHTFSAEAVDAAGRMGKPVSYTWAVDLTPPDTRIKKAPPATTHLTKATFGYSSTEKKSTFQCSLDGAAFAPCQKSYSGLATGPHTLAARAVDAAGNVDPTPAVATWTIV